MGGVTEKAVDQDEMHVIGNVDLCSRDHIEDCDIPKRIFQRVSVCLIFGKQGGCRFSRRIQ